MCIGHVGHIYIVLKIGSWSKKEGGLASGDAFVQCRDQDWVVWPEDGGRTQSASGEASAISRDDKILCYCLRNISTLKKGRAAQLAQQIDDRDGAGET